MRVEYTGVSHRFYGRRAAVSSPESNPQRNADIQLDEQGRIIINAPELASALESAGLRAAGLRPTNGVCPIVNAVAGCGERPI